MLPPAFYQREDVVQIAQDLLGKWLFTKIGNDPITGGVIVETEAYAGTTDRACHAYNGRRTPRTETMYHAGGIAYVYLCYGMHNLLNVVTHQEGIPHAVLIRAIQPTHGLDLMRTRRARKIPLISGPGTVCQALGITRAHNGLPLSSTTLWIEDRDTRISQNMIQTGPRIGVEYAKEDALLPWRFRTLANAVNSL